MSHTSGNTRHCVIIPSYNSGHLLKATVREVLAYSSTVIVVIDGSTDGSQTDLILLADETPQLHIITLPMNSGKGAAVLKGFEFALQQGFTHAVVFDSDGQHGASDLPRFFAASVKYPEAMILGVPLFGTEAPRLRVNGRLVGNWWTNLETLWGGIHDSLFGFRLYPIIPSLQILNSIRGGRRFDFDTQLAVRLYWLGVPPVNLTTPVYYKKKDAGGVSHFRYFRDNLLLVVIHTRLTLRALTIIPRLIQLRHQNRLNVQ
jgi:glycosyltransferase involved in cell wall biosynthesis